MSENRGAPSDDSGTPPIDDLAKRLTRIDDRLLELLAERACYAQQLGRSLRLTGQVSYDPNLHEATIARLEQAIAGKDSCLSRNAVRVIFREILGACAVLETPVRIGYLGPPGTFSHMAARSAFGLGPTYVEFPDFLAIFRAVDRKQIEFGIVPFENSTEGGVTFTLDCFLTSAAQIRREFLLDVSQCLIGREHDFARIERVYSHPQPLAQARAWLASQLPRAQLVATPSTTAAAREAADDPAAAAVASHLAAELYQLDILAESIQDVADNVTRFVVIANTDAQATGRDKTSLFFSTPDEKGALLRALAIFYDEGLNLSRIESRPAREKLWEYVFFADVQGHRTDPPVERAIKALEATCRTIKVLGSYPRAE